MIMQEQSKIEETVESIKDYANTQYELIILKGSDKLSHISSGLFSFLPIIFLTIITTLMLSFGLAFYLNNVLLSEYAGFFILGGAYCIIGLILVSIRKKSIAKPLRNIIIRELFRENNL
jgi:hypothetical protein